MEISNKVNLRLELEGFTLSLHHKSPQSPNHQHRLRTMEITTISKKAMAKQIQTTRNRATAIMADKEAGAMVEEDSLEIIKIGEDIKSRKTLMEEEIRVELIGKEEMVEVAERLDKIKTSSLSSKSMRAVVEEDNGTVGATTIEEETAVDIVVDEVAIANLGRTATEEEVAMDAAEEEVVLEDFEELGSLLMVVETISTSNALTNRSPLKKSPRSKLLSSN